jgi:hypothetical protein
MKHREICSKFACVTYESSNGFSRFEFATLLRLNFNLPLFPTVIPNPLQNSWHRPKNLSNPQSLTAQAPQKLLSPFDDDILKNELFSLTKADVGRERQI